MLKELLIFAGGAGVGALVAWRVIDSKYDKRYETDMQSMRDELDKLHSESIERSKALASEATKKPDISNYSGMVEKSSIVVPETIDMSGLDKYHNILKKVEDFKIEPSEPIVQLGQRINAEENSRFNGNNKKTLTYYEDGALADEYDELMDVENTIGTKILDFDGTETSPFDILGHQQYDAIYIQRLGVDYELIRDTRTYTDVTGIYYEGGGDVK